MSDPTQPVPPAATPAPEAGAPTVVAPAAAAAPRVLNPYSAPKPAAEPPAADPRIASLEATIAGLAADELAAAPENVRKVVMGIAGENPNEQIRVLRALRSNGMATAPQVIPAGTTTAPIAAQPAPAAPASPDAVALAEYERLTSKGATLLASQYRSRNAVSIERAMRSRNPVN